MDTSVKLQGMLSFSKNPLLIFGAVIVAYLLMIVILFVIRILKKRKPVKKAATVQEHRPVRNKQKYLAELDSIKAEYDAGRIDYRKAYNRTSLCVRKFVHAATGKKVQSYTLEDIKNEGMTGLGQLIEEFYKPEFARESESDFESSLQKTKKVIEQWN